MKTRLKKCSVVVFTFVVVSTFVFVPGCSRFTKQYRCHVPGKAEPRTPYEYVERSSEHMRMDQVDCALGACEEAIRLDKNYAPGYACRGSIRGQKADYHGALKDFDYAIKLQAGNGDYYHQRSQVHDYLNNMDQAMADVTKATELQGSDFSRSLSFAFRGRLYRKQSKYLEAANDYTAAIKLSPDFAYHWGNRGNVYAELKDYNKAIADLDEAIKLDPKNRYFFRDRASAYRAIGRNDLAAQDEATAETILSGGTGPSESPSPSGSPSPEGFSIDIKQPVVSSMLEGRVVSLPKPLYPAFGTRVRVRGTVVVQVLVDRAGKVISAKAASGHPLLMASCVKAAVESKFQPFVAGEVSGTITYEFV